MAALPGEQAIHARFVAKVILHAAHRLKIAIAPLGQPAGLNVVVL